MEYCAENHTYIVCAYKECAFLEECIVSLLHQTVQSKIAIATGTPNAFIEGLAKKYALPLFVNHESCGIASDWSFALSCADSELVTLAHQDDVYDCRYTERMLACMNRAKDPILFSCNYGELKDGKRIYKDTMLRVKRLMCMPMHLFPDSRIMRRLTLAFGNPIICPGVTYLSSIMRERPFVSHMKSNLDWEKWEELSNLKGSFIYTRDILVWHRIHPDAETSRIVNMNKRGAEDYEMFLKFHFAPVARLINRIYSNGEKTYTK